MYLKNGSEQYVRMLVTDGDPLEYAKVVLKKEEKDIFSQLMNFSPSEETNLLLLNKKKKKNSNLKCLEEELSGKIKI